MTKAKHSGAFKGHRFPPEFIAYAVWSYFRFPLSLRDVEDLFAVRGIIVSYETIRKWVGKFGTKYAASIRRDRPAPSDKWHLDEVKWSGKIGQRAKVYPTRLNGYENDKATEFFRQV